MADHDTDSDGDTPLDGDSETSADSGAVGERDESFEADVATARQLLDRDDLDGLYVGVVHDGELDYQLAHRSDEPEEMGRRALALLAKHVQALADESGVPVDQVATDAARFADQFD